MPPIRMSGAVATIGVDITTYPPPDSQAPDYASSTDRYVFDQLQRQLRDMHESIRASVKRDLGPDVEVDPLALRYGSVELLVVITTVFTIIKNFNEYVEAMEKAAENVRRIVVRVLDFPVPALTAVTRAHVELSERLQAQEASPSNGSDSSIRPAAAGTGRLSVTSDPTQLLLLVNFLVLVALVVLVAVKQ